MFHYSAKKIDKVHSVEQSKKVEWKPKGLWVAPGDEWREHCRDWKPVDDHYRYKVELNWKQILLIDTIDKLNDFNHHFARSGKVNWYAISRICNGIVIDPYQWDSRMEIDWYYGWDIASGCIWDVNAILDIKLV